MVFLEYINFEHNTVAAELVRQTYDTPPLAFVHSYGCQQNVNDGERIKGVLVDIGYGLCDKPENADLILFNTCAVREHAEQRVFGNVGALKGLKEKKPGLIIGLCGCMANQKHVVEKLRKSYPYVDLVFGVDGIDTLPQLIAQKLQKHKRVLLDPAQRPVIVENIPIRRESEFRAWLPIMYGCDNFCSYCIVQNVRGRERSRASADILREFRQLVAEGYKDITLLGQNVNSYGKGLPEDITFAALLLMLDAFPVDYRIRFMTSHPKDATRELIDTIANSAHISRHLHLPVQSGSNSILAQMNRKYTVEDYLSLIAYAKRRMPEMTYSSDIIVGFPGETEEDFCATEALIAPFQQVIKTSGQVLAAQGDESVAVATVAGVVSFRGKVTEGMSVGNGTPLVTISSNNIADGDPVQRARIAYEVSKKEYERMKALVKNKIVSDKEFAQAEQNYENARISYEALSKNHSAIGQNITAPIAGYVKSILVKEGDYVTIGQPLVSVTQNRRLFLRAEVSEKYYPYLRTISSANFQTPYNNKVYELQALNGKLLSFGKTAGDNSFYVPVTFEFDNKGEVIPGSFVEVFLLSSPMENVISLPRTALTEEQGSYFVYLQLDEEGYKKQEVTVGADNGKNVQILSGVKAGDRVVTEGAYQVRLASANNAIPAHSHEH